MGVLRSNWLVAVGLVVNLACPALGLPEQDTRRVADLQKIHGQIEIAATSKEVNEDLETLHRLQEEFRNELATLRERVADLELKSRSIESKLEGLAGK